MTQIEKKHIISAFEFELGKVTKLEIRERVLAQLYQVDKDLASELETKLGIKIKVFQSIVQTKKHRAVSEKLSLIKNNYNHIKNRKIAILLAEGFNFENLQKIKFLLAEKGLLSKIVSKTLAPVLAGDTTDNLTITPDATFITMPSIMFDAVVIPCGLNSANFLRQSDETNYFLTETYKHLKPIAVIGYGCQVLEKSNFIDDDEGIFFGKLDQTNVVIEKLLRSLMQHRVWSRELNLSLPVRKTVY